MRLCVLVTLLTVCLNPFFISAATITQAEYFDSQGLSVLVFHNNYPEGHQGGVEIILHDQRIATNGDVRLAPTPGQWDPLPEIGEREVNRKRRHISIQGAYSDLDIQYTIHVTANKETFRIAVDLDHALPLQWVGKVGFNLELFPPSFFGKTWHTESESGLFPRQAMGPVKLNSHNSSVPLPLCTDRRLSLAPEDPLCHLTIESSQNDISLYDGRIPDNNGWFVVRSLVPAGATKNAIVWEVRPHVLEDWRHPVKLLHSQVGYHPEQRKRALFEIDPRDKRRERAQLVRITPDGDPQVVLAETPKRWGSFLRYDYLVFDFSSISTPGTYVIRYREQNSEPFRIDPAIY